MPLKLETYKDSELAGTLALSARAVQASSPVTFNHIGYPDKITDDSQILWFVDAMHEDNGQPAAVYSDDYMVTDDEIALINEVGDLVEELTEEQFGKRIRPWSSLLFCLNMFRLVKAFSAWAGENFSVYEIGPGSGYLGALLIRSGHRYMATDIAEGFYLWQSRLFEKMADGDFTELAEDASTAPFADPQSRVVHVPWWKHASYYKDPCPLNPSLVVCDHALGEMSYLGLKYTIASSRDLLRGSGVRALLTTSIGFPHVNELHDIITHFYQGGFVPLIAQGPIAFVPNESDMAPMGILPDALQDEIRHPGVSREVDDRLVEIGRSENYYFVGEPSELKSAKSVFTVDWDHAPLDYSFMDYIGDAVPESNNG